MSEITNEAREAAETPRWKAINELALAGVKFEDSDSLIKVRDILCDRDARIAELEKAQEWRPIDTAPKDGSHVLIWSYGPGVESGCWSDSCRPAGWLAGGGVSTPRAPAFWMPLPNPPNRNSSTVPDEREEWRMLEVGEITKAGDQRAYTDRYQYVREKHTGITVSIKGEYRRRVSRRQPEDKQ